MINQNTFYRHSVKLRLIMESTQMKSQRDLYAEKFAEYAIDGLTRAGIKQAELARRAKVSPQIISQIINKKPHQLTGKLILPERETVEAIARAFGDDPSIARKAAGYSDTTPDAEPADTVEEALRNAFMFGGVPLSDEEIEKLRPYMEMLDREIDRVRALSKRPEAP
jgi:transcriptional regulator with XRE-family HTH domain